jgi:hypothetical protein
VACTAELLRAGLKECAARDRWIGWDFRHQYDRLHLIANNARFLVLSGQHYPHLGSRILALCERRLAQDWSKRFGHPLWLLETFVDPRFFHGTIYRAANWEYVGDTRGFRRTRAGYSAATQASKRAFVRPLVAHVQPRLSLPVLDHAYQPGAPKLISSADHMRSLPAFFAIERTRIEKKTTEVSTETVYGLTNHTPEGADAARLLAFNRDHWGVEAHHYILDWNWDEDRCTLRTGHGPENITRLRRFATGLIKSNSRDSVAATIAKLARNVRPVFDYLHMIENSTSRSPASIPFRTDLPCTLHRGGCQNLRRVQGGDAAPNILGVASLAWSDTRVPRPMFQGNSLAEVSPRFSSYHAQQCAQKGILVCFARDGENRIEILAHGKFGEAASHVGEGEMAASGNSMAAFWFVFKLVGGSPPPPCPWCSDSADTR